jgi:hypothetical protein
MRAVDSEATPLSETEDENDTAGHTGKNPEDQERAEQLNAAIKRAACEQGVL